MRELLRFATAGSVDDGKSTLIGRLLLRLEGDLRGPARGGRAHVPRRAATSYTNLALLTDGLRAEREQGITIDVAYRYFATPQAQVHHRRHPRPHPVHAQHGHRRVDRRPRADPRRRPQRRARAVPPPRVPRVAAAACPHLVLCVNKMDLVDYDQARLRRDPRRVHRVRRQARDHRPRRSSRSRRCTATTSSSARDNMPWYDGPPLLHHLEDVHIASDRNLIDARFPVQYVIRPHDGRAPRLPRLRRHGRRRHLQAGRRGDGAAVAASPRRSSEHRHGRRRRSTRRFPPMSVTIRLADDLDISRGDMICRPHNQPTVTQDIDAMICWFERPRRCAPARQVRRSSTRPAARVPWSRPALPARRQHAAPRRDADVARLNEIGRVRLRTTAPLLLRRVPAATARPAASSSSTRRPTTPSPPA